MISDYKKEYKEFYIEGKPFIVRVPKMKLYSGKR